MCVCNGVGLTMIKKSWTKEDSPCLMQEHASPCGDYETKLNGERIIVMILQNNDYRYKHVWKRKRHIEAKTKSLNQRNVK